MHTLIQCFHYLETCWRERCKGQIHRVCYGFVTCGLCKKTLLWLAAAVSYTLLQAVAPGHQWTGTPFPWYGTYPGHPRPGTLISWRGAPRCRNAPQRGGGGGGVRFLNVLGNPVTAFEMAEVGGRNCVKSGPWSAKSIDQSIPKRQEPVWQKISTYLVVLCVCLWLRM